MDELLSNIQRWIEMKIDALATGNPQMALFAPRIKKGIYNLIKQNIGKIEPIMPFLTDEDGNIDNITDLYQKSMSGSKKINNVYFTPQTAYLACDFGIVALNIKKKEFTETYILETEGDSPEILNVIVANDTIYALTKKNLFSANIKSNLINYQNWTKLNIPDYNDNNVKIEFIDNELYLLKNNQNLYKYHNNNWKLYKNN